MKKPYKKHEETPMIAQEASIEYKAKSEIDTTQLPSISMKEVLQNGMSLDESKRLITEKIHSDFHKA